VALPVSACGSDRDARSGGNGPVRIVASTNVYGSIAASIGGSAVEVDSLIDSPAQDPHSFEANAHDELAVSKADILLQNGGGYDDFMTALRRSVGATSTELIDAVSLRRTPAVDGRLNEHVWYDLATVQHLAARLAAVLGREDPASHAVFARNAAAFIARLEHLRRIEAALAARYRGDGVAITEPVPLYLLADCGLVNRTPQRFSAAVEQDTGVPVSVLRSTEQLFGHHLVRLLVYNAQTAGPETTAVRAAANTAHVPVVPVTETLPQGEDFLAWMTANLVAVQSALTHGAKS
jgi:zinc/manganese transport system substrate-binding protein